MLRRLRPRSVYVDGSLTGQDVFDNAISGDDVINSSVTGTDVKDGSLGTPDIAELHGSRLVTGSVAGSRPGRER